MTYAILLRCRSFLPWVFACVMLPSPSALGQDTSYVSGLTWTITPRLEHFHYQERDAEGSQLNREKGTLQGMQAALEYTHGNLQLSASAARISGRVDYQGRTQAGNPLSTDTDEGVTRYTLSSHMQVWSSERFQFSPFLAARYSIWNRDILATSRTLSLTETYRWWTLSAGARICSGPSVMSGSLCLQAGLSRTTHGEITVNLQQIGQGKPVLELGEDSGEEITLGWHSKRYLLHIYYQEWQFSASNSKGINSGSVILTIQEPASKTRIVGLAGGLRF